MLAVPLPAATVLASLPAALELAADNAPSRCVVAGPPDAVAAYAQTLVRQGHSCQPLPTAHAFHTAAVAPLQEAFGAAVAACRLQPPRRRCSRT